MEIGSEQRTNGTTSTEKKAKVLIDADEDFDKEDEVELKVDFGNE